MDAAGDREAGAPDSDLEPRLPEERDLVLLCRRLNELGAQYLVVGGFAVIYGGYPRTTNDIDLVLATDLENEARVFRALEVLPDKAVRELDPGDVARHTVVRVADEVIVDLMRSAAGIEYAEAADDVIVRHVQGVPIPFAVAPFALENESKDAPRKRRAGPGFLARILRRSRRNSSALIG